MNSINYAHLEAIAKDSWKDGVPNALGIPQDASQKDKAVKDLENLSKITSLVKAALNNPDETTVVHKIIDKCFKYAENANTELALKAFNICINTLPAANNSKYGESFTLKVGGKDFSLPSYYKKILGKESEFFRGMFESENAFKEKNSQFITLEDMDSHTFQQILDRIHGKEPDFTDLPQLIKFLEATDKLLMPRFSDIAQNQLIETIKDFEISEDHFNIARDLRQWLPQPAVQKVLDNYQFKYVASHFKDFNEFLVVLKGEAPNIQSLDLSSYKNLNDDQIAKLIEAFPHLEELVIRSNLITDEGVKSICKNLPYLQSLDLGKCKKITDAGFSSIGSLENLNTINLFETNLGDVCLSHLTALKNLKSLDFSENKKLTDAGLVHLAGHTGMQDLNLRGCGNVSNTGIAHLKNFKALVNLDLSFNKLSYEGLKNLIQTETLQSLTLNGCSELTDASIETIADSFKKLKILKLDGCPLITDSGIKKLVSLSSLEQLRLKGSKLTDVGVFYLASLTCLKDLDISRCTVTNQAIESLSLLKELNTLNLGGCYNLTSACLKKLSQLTNLRTLGLSACKIGDEGFDSISNFTNLRSLNISNCKEISDIGIKHLRLLPKIETLSLAGCDKITNTGLAQLSTLKALEYLDISGGPKVAIGSLKYLSVHTSLKTLNLSSYSGIKDSEIKHLSALTNLEYLNLTGSQIRNLDHLIPMTGLQRLNLSRTLILDSQLSKLSHFKKLYYLNLSDLRITNEGLKKINSLNTLYTLDINSCGLITDSGIQFLTGIKTLEQLNLTFCSRLTNACLPHFTLFKALDWLNLKVTDIQKEAALIALENQVKAGLELYVD